MCRRRGLQVVNIAGFECRFPQFDLEIISFSSNIDLDIEFFMPLGFKNSKSADQLNIDSLFLNSQIPTLMTDFIENHQNYEKGLAMTVYGCQMSQSFV